MTVSTATITAAPERGPLIGVAAQLVSLTILAGTPGLSPAGLLLGVGYGLVLCALLAAGLRRSQQDRLGWANTVTLTRAVLVGGVTALVVTSFTRPTNVAVLVSLAAVALALDGVDGQVARRTGTTSALGARFDLEVDAFLILVLAGYVGVQFGWWVVALGAFRYAFVAASWVWPWLNAPLPPKFSRKVVAALQGVILAFVAADLTPVWLGYGALAVALASLTWSFGRDIRWCYGNGPGTPQAGWRRPAWSMISSITWVQTAIGGNSCPTPSNQTSRAPGISSAKARGYSAAATVSSVPCMISVGAVISPSRGRAEGPASISQ